jgi:macrolide-specific efflux system membrane fusion protein
LLVVMDMGRWLWQVAVMLLLLSGTTVSAAEEVQVSSVLIKLMEQVEVPAREAGVLTEIRVREGDMVALGSPVAQIEDGDAQLDKRRAELELIAARKQADNDVKVRYARKSLEVSESELRRALDSSKRLAQSVSQSELDQLKLEVQRNTLEIEQAQLELDVAKTAGALRENDVAIAEFAIAQRHIVAPLAGFVAELLRQRGEWVQPGQPILRLLRLDRLRAEGLVSAQAAGNDLNGRPVKLSVDVDGNGSKQFDGKIVFVSPEIDPVNGQVRVWAEIENPRFELRPGLHGSMVIERGAASKKAR